MAFLIYKHTCVVTQKAYVGYTSKSMEERWNSHVKSAFCKREINEFNKFHFQNAIKKYGVVCWEHEVLQDNIQTIEEAWEAEKRWIRLFNTFGDGGYNETLGGGGVVLNEEGRERHRKATIAALHRPDVRQRYLEGIRRGHCTPEFKAKNKKAQKIAQNRPDVVKNKRRKMNEFYARPEYVSPCARTVEQLTLEGESIAIFRSAKEAHKATGVNYTKITEVARGDRKQSGGFRWRYLD